MKRHVIFLTNTLIAQSIATHLSLQGTVAPQFQSSEGEAVKVLSFIMIAADGDAR